MTRDAYYGDDRGPAFDTDAAYDFLYRSGGPVEHARLSHWRRDSDSNALWRTLERFQNPDGGWAHGIDPDYSGAVSSVQSTIEALRILVAHKQGDNPGVQRTVAWLKSVQGPDGTWQETPDVMRAGAPEWYEPARFRIWETACIAGYCLELGYTDLWSPAARYVRNTWAQMPPAETGHPYWATLLLLGRSQADPDVAISRECLDRLRQIVRRERVDAYDCSWLVEVLVSLDNRAVADMNIQLGDTLASRQAPDGGIETEYGDHLRTKATFNSLMAVALIQHQGY